MKKDMQKNMIRHFTGCFVAIAIALLMTANGVSGATLNKVFTGTVSLDGDISDFFQADGVTPKDGVCVANDPNGLDEPPVSAAASQDLLAHPSGFNQRRIMSAYNPSLNNGTIFIGIDLPGGSGPDNVSKTVHSFPGNPNPNYNDGVVGANFGGGGSGRGKIVPFDADANGEADTIGRRAAGGNLFRCPPGAGDVVDILNCAAAAATGANDNPRVASGSNFGVRENYVATMNFGNGAFITVELFQAGPTPAGVAQVAFADSGTLDGPWGAIVSTSTGAAGTVLGWDVEIAITNVNAAVADPCARLSQALVVDSGSNADGAGQGEDSNVGFCDYDLPATVQCQVLFFGTNGVQIVNNQCGTAAPLGVLVGTPYEVRVAITAPAANAQSLNNCAINAQLPGGPVFVGVPGVLNPGDTSVVSLGTVVCDMPGVQTVTAVVSCEGVVSGNCFPIQSTCQEAIQCCGLPCIQVIKEIACLEIGGSCGPFSKSATGAKDTACPQFCYKITVINCGSVGLHNITVIDDVFGDLSGIFADMLAVGASESHNIEATHCVDVVNTVTAEAEGAFGSGHVMANDTAAAHVLQASVSCEKIVTSPDDLDGNPNDNHVLLPSDGLPHTVTYGVVVTVGPVPLNITVMDLDPTCATTVFGGPFSNTVVTAVLCQKDLICPDIGSVTNTMVVTGTVDTSTGICGLDGNGQPITVHSQCSAVVECQPTCPTCDGNVVMVDPPGVTINFNNNPPTYSGDPDLLPYFSYDNSGPTPDTWKAIFNLGPKKLLVKSGATITTTQVPPGTNNRRAPGIEILSTCELEVEQGGYITVGSLNRQAGNILIQVDGNITINGVVSNTVAGTNGRPGDIRIGSKCGTIYTGPTSKIITYGQDFGGSDINIATCETGDVRINGLVDASYKAKQASTIRISAFGGDVSIDGTTSLGTEVVAGSLRTVSSGVSVRSRRDPLPGTILIQAYDEINVLGSRLLSKKYPNYGAVAIKTASNSSKGGLIDARAGGEIVLIDRALDNANRFNTAAVTRALAGGGIQMGVTGSIDDGAANNSKPVVTSQGGDTGQGGTNMLRGLGTGVQVFPLAQVLADFTGRPGSVGVNILSGCTGVTEDPLAVVSPADAAGDDVGVCGTPNPLFLDCSELGLLFP